ncbi:MAG: hypothetical protein ACMXYC_04860 [Candidatus Woesearchaeota archaeon]
MTIIGFNFLKIDAQRLQGAGQAKINVSNNVSIKEVHSAEINLTGSASAGLRYVFTYTAVYEPSVGKITLEGEVLTMDDKKVCDDILSGWKEKKALPQQQSQSILNTILSKSTVQALILSRELNLPAPIPIPKVKQEVKQEAASEKKA